MKHLYRSDKNKTLAGVLGGLGEYMNTDPVILRFAYVLLTAFSGIFPGVIAYLFAIGIIPKHGHNSSASHTDTLNVS